MNQSIKYFYNISFCILETTGITAFQKEVKDEKKMVNVYDEV